MANAIRALAMDAVEQAKSGHPGLPMGAADIATVLFTRFLKFDPADPAWPDRDRFVLSAGHGSMLIYALLHLTGYASVTLDDIKNFRKLNYRTPGHPENFVTTGIETTTGPLGQGIANAVGMAIAERHLAAQFGSEIVDHHTYVLASDGDLMEGISQEAIALAGHLKLNRMIVLFDDNGITIDGKLSLADSVDQVKRFEAAGWRAERIDGHDPEAIASAIERAQNSDRPSLIACKTTIGFGAPNKAGSEKSHGSPLGADEIAGARKNLGWDFPAFEVPGDIRALWTQAGQRAKDAHKAWDKRLGALDAAKRAEFQRRIAGELPKAKLAAAVKSVKETLAATPKDIATRSSSEFALEALTEAVPEMIGGSADLTGSNNTRTKAMKAMSPNDYGARFIHYGIREHGMAAAMNGMALHGGIIPYSGTFLVFSDYCRPAIRLAALMGERVIHVMTHDSIGLGEDGPTHQPVEHLAALARDSESPRVPSGRRGRDAGMLGARSAGEGSPERAGADAAEPAAASHRRGCGQYLRRRRLRDRGSRRTGRCLDLRHRLGSLHRGRCRQADRRARGFRAGGLGAVLRIVPRAAGRPAPEHHRLVETAHRRRSRRAPGLGRDHRPGRPFHRHVLVRRQRALQGPLQAFRDYPRSGREGGIGQARKGLTALDKAARDSQLSGWVALHTAPICAT